MQNDTFSLVIRFVLEGLASGIFIYVACMPKITWPRNYKLLGLEMLAHEFSPHSHSHNEPKDVGHHHHGTLITLSLFTANMDNVQATRLEPVL
jgi:hypothetical protein